MCDNWLDETIDSDYDIGSGYNEEIDSEELFEDSLGEIDSDVASNVASVPWVLLFPTVWSPTDEPDIREPAGYNEGSYRERRPEEDPRPGPSLLTYTSTPVLLH